MRSQVSPPVAGPVDVTLPRRAGGVAAGHVTEGRDDRVAVVGIAGQLPAHARVRHRQAGAYLPPSAPGVLAPVDAAVGAGGGGPSTGASRVPLPGTAPAGRRAA